MFPDMAPDTSTYQAFKIWLDGYVPVKRDTLHFIVGVALLVGTFAVARGRSMRWRLTVAFALSLAAGLLMEALDRRDDIAWLGYWRIGASAADVMRTVAVPLGLLVLSLVWPRAKSRDPT